ncbi:MAG: carboxypeptidase-like regulatory domain-containing protein [Planctomycetota bacterium]
MTGKRVTGRVVRLLLAFALLTVGAGHQGCSSPPRHSGSGTVRFEDGEPVRAGSVELRSLASGSRYASRINSDGAFQLLDDDGDAGIPPGQYEAVVVLIVLTEDLAAAEHAHGRNVPTRYADYYTSGLTATVESPDSGPIELVLQPE